MAGSQPEIFETPDVPEAEEPQADAQEHKTSDDVVQYHLEAPVAFEQFAGRVYDIIPPGFADMEIHRISSAQPELSSQSRSARLFETPLERYSRLREEVDSFQQDLKLLAAKTRTGKDGKPDAKSKLGSLLSTQLDTLQQELTKALENPAFRPFLQHGARNVEDVEQKRLLEHLQMQLETAAKAQVEQKSGAGTDGSITYELYYNPAKENGRVQVNFSDLDRRLSSLERTLGMMKDEKGMGFPDVCSVLYSLQQRLELLKQDKLDAIARRIKVLLDDLQGLDKVKDAKQGPEASAIQEKVNKMYDMMERWDQAALLLPSVITRLQSLKDLHEESSGSIVRLQKAERRLMEMEGIRQTDRQALDTVGKNLAHSVSLMNGNVKVLEKRFSELAEKMAKLGVK